MRGLLYWLESIVFTDWILFTIDCSNPIWGDFSIAWSTAYKTYVNHRREEQGWKAGWCDLPADPLWQFGADWDGPDPTICRLPFRIACCDALPLRPDWSRSGVYRNQVRHHRRGVCQTGWMDRSFLAKVRACSSSDSYGFPAFQRSNVQLSRSDFFSLDAQDIEDKVLAVRQELVWLLSRIWYS